MPDTVTPAEMRERPHGAVFRALISVDVDPGLAQDASEEVRERTGDNIVAAVRLAEGRINLRLDAQSVEIQSLKGEVQSLKGEVQSLNDKFESLSGEVQSVKGEIQSVKGEIQSIHKELTVSRWAFSIGFAVIAIMIAITSIVGN